MNAFLIGGCRPTKVQEWAIQSVQQFLFLPLCTSSLSSSSVSTSSYSGAVSSRLSLCKKQETPGGSIGDGTASWATRPPPPPSTTTSVLPVPSTATSSFSASTSPFRFLHLPSRPPSLMCETLVGRRPSFVVMRKYPRFTYARDASFSSPSSSENPSTALQKDMLARRQKNDIHHEEEEPLPPPIGRVRVSRAFAQAYANLSSAVEREEYWRTYYVTQWQNGADLSPLSSCASFSTPSSPLSFVARQVMRLRQEEWPLKESEVEPWLRREEGKEQEESERVERTILNEENTVEGPALAAASAVTVRAEAEMKEEDEERTPDVVGNLEEETEEEEEDESAFLALLEGSSSSTTSSHHTVTSPSSASGQHGRTNPTTTPPSALRRPFTMPHPHRRKGLPPFIPPPLFYWEVTLCGEPHYAFLILPDTLLSSSPLPEEEEEKEKREEVQTEDPRSVGIVPPSTEVCPHPRNASLSLVFPSSPTGSAVLLPPLSHHPENRTGEIPSDVLVRNHKDKDGEATFRVYHTTEKCSHQSAFHTFPSALLSYFPKSRPLYALPASWSHTVTSSEWLSDRQPETKGATTCTITATAGGGSTSEHRTHEDGSQTIRAPFSPPFSPSPPAGSPALAAAPSSLLPAMGNARVQLAAPPSIWIPLPLLFHLPLLKQCFRFRRGEGRGGIGNAAVAEKESVPHDTANQGPTHVWKRNSDDTVTTGTEGGEEDEEEGHSNASSSLQNTRKTQVAKRFSQLNAVGQGERKMKKALLPPVIDEDGTEVEEDESASAVSTNRSSKTHMEPSSAFWDSSSSSGSPSVSHARSSRSFFSKPLPSLDHQRDADAEKAAHPRGASSSTDVVVSTETTSFPWNSRDKASALRREGVEHGKALADALWPSFGASVISSFSPFSSVSGVATSSSLPSYSIPLCAFSLFFYWWRSSRTVFSKVPYHAPVIPLSSTASPLSSTSSTTDSFLLAPLSPSFQSIYVMGCGEYINVNETVLGPLMDSSFCSQYKVPLTETGTVFIEAMSVIQEVTCEVRHPSHFFSSSSFLSRGWFRRKTLGGYKKRERRHIGVSKDHKVLSLHSTSSSLGWSHPLAPAMEGSSPVEEPCETRNGKADRRNSGKRQGHRKEGQPSPTRVAIRKRSQYFSSVTSAGATTMVDEKNSPTADHAVPTTAATLAKGDHFHSKKEKKTKRTKKTTSSAAVVKEGMEKEREEESEASTASNSETATTTSVQDTLALPSPSPTPPAAGNTSPEETNMWWKRMLACREREEAWQKKMEAQTVSQLEASRRTPSSSSPSATGEGGSGGGPSFVSCAAEGDSTSIASYHTPPLYTTSSSSQSSAPSSRQPFTSPYWIAVDTLEQRWGVALSPHPSVRFITVNGKKYVNAENTTDASKFCAENCYPGLLHQLLGFYGVRTCSFEFSQALQEVLRHHHVSMPALSVRQEAMVSTMTGPHRTPASSSETTSSFPLPHNPLATYASGWNTTSTATRACSSSSSSSLVSAKEWSSTAPPSTSACIDSMPSDHLWVSLRLALTLGWSLVEGALLVHLETGNTAAVGCGRKTGMAFTCLPPRIRTTSVFESQKGIEAYLFLSNRPTTRTTNSTSTRASASCASPSSSSYRSPRFPHAGAAVLSEGCRCGYHEGNDSTTTRPRSSFHQDDAAAAGTTPKKASNAFPWREEKTTVKHKNQEKKASHDVWGIHDTREHQGREEEGMSSGSTSRRTEDHHQPEVQNYNCGTGKKKYGNEAYGKGPHPKDAWKSSKYMKKRKESQEGNEKVVDWFSSSTSKSEGTASPSSASKDLSDRITSSYATSSSSNCFFFTAECFTDPERFQKFVNSVDTLPDTLVNVAHVLQYEEVMWLVSYSPTLLVRSPMKLEDTTVKPTKEISKRSPFHALRSNASPAAATSPWRGASRSAGGRLYREGKPCSATPHHDPTWTGEKKHSLTTFPSSYGDLQEREKKDHTAIQLYLGRSRRVHTFLFPSSRVLLGIFALLHAYSDTPRSLSVSSVRTGLSVSMTSTRHTDKNLNSGKEEKVVIDSPSLPTLSARPSVTSFWCSSIFLTDEPGTRVKPVEDVMETGNTMKQTLLSNTQKSELQKPFSTTSIPKFIPGTNEVLPPSVVVSLRPSVVGQGVFSSSGGGGARVGGKQIRLNLYHREQLLLPKDLEEAFHPKRILSF